MKEDQIKGRYKTIKGKTKETVGKIIGNKEMEIDGATQKNVGKVQTAYGDLKNDLDKND